MTATPTAADNGHLHSKDAIRYRPEIDGLRAVAVLPVLLFHAGLSMFSGGFVGVDIFFVISGYLITGILLREILAGHFSIAKFYERRVRRIFPALFAMIFVTALAACFVLLPDELEALGKQIAAADLFVSNVLFWKEAGYFDPESTTKPLLHTWSLAVEEQYYIIFPLLLLLIARLEFRFIRLILGIATILAVVAGIVLLHASSEFAFYMLPARLFELLLGGVVAAVPAYGGRHGALISWAGLAAIALAVFTYVESMHFPGAAALLPCAGAAAFLWAARGTSAATLLSVRPLRAVGLISYSLYLWHWPIIVLMGLKYGALRASGIVIAIALSFAAATLSWYFVEQPWRRARTPRSVAIMGGACIAGGLALAAIFLFTDGLPGRYQDERRVAYERTAQEKQILKAAYSCGTEPLFADSDRYGICDLGPAGQPRVIVIGDSIAMALKPAFEEAFAKRGVPAELISSPGCIPLIGLDRVDHMGRCSARSDTILRHVVTRKPDAIIFLAAWAGVLDKKNTVYDGRQSDDDASRLANLGDALDGTVKAYRGIPVTIGMFKPLPGVPIPTGRAIARQSKERLTLTAARYTDRYGDLNRRIDAQPIDTVLGPAAFLCDPDCAAVDGDGVPIYLDNLHPSSAGNRLLQPLIDEMVGSVLAKGRGE